MPRRNQHAITVLDDDGVQHELPTRFEVCPTCEGRGTHVNRSIDGNGISADRFAEDPDFAEAYMAGHYDVTCEECGGRNVVPVVDEPRCPPALLKLYQEAEEAAAECEREERYWSRLESYACGERD